MNPNPYTGFPAGRVCIWVMSCKGRNKRTICKIVLQEKRFAKSFYNGNDFAKSFYNGNDFAKSFYNGNDLQNCFTKETIYKIADYNGFRGGCSFSMPPISHTKTQRHREKAQRGV